jgi:hypothetical protein
MRKVLDGETAGLGLPSFNVTGILLHSERRCNYSMRLSGKNSQTTFRAYFRNTFGVFSTVS